MHYAILCYDSEAVVGAWTKEQDDAVLAKLGAVKDKLAKERRLGPVVRLMPTTAATTVRKGKEAAVLDGPFAETKEQLGGYYLIEAKDLNEAIQVASRIPSAKLGCIEVRPVQEHGI